MNFLDNIVQNVVPSILIISLGWILDYFNFQFYVFIETVRTPNGSFYIILILAL